jgi:hypothetical protein
MERMFYQIQRFGERRAGTHKIDDGDVSRTAGRVWSKAAPNPIDWEVRTARGVFTTQDRTTLRTASGSCTAELRVLHIAGGGHLGADYVASHWAGLHVAESSSDVRWSGRGGRPWHAVFVEPLSQVL